MGLFNRAHVLGILYESEVRLTARAYVQGIAVALSISLIQAKIILKALVDEGELTYQDLYGGTYVAQSFLKPVRVSPHFFLKPPGIKSLASPQEKDILIHPGIAFGSGHHPTTRLSLEAIDTLFFDRPEIVFDRKSGGVDLGTGSGVLAIAMCLAGLGRCRAFDIDPTAVAEARQNVAANHLGQRIQVIGDYMGIGETGFSIICANLRFPTLIRISSLIKSSLSPQGVIILSGVRQWEKQELIVHYGEVGFSPVWDKDEKNWSALIMTQGQGIMTTLPE